MEKKLLGIIQVIIGWEWLISGFDKIQAGQNYGKEFLGAITKFSSKNPYPFYKNFLNNFVLKTDSVFSILIPWGEFLSGLMLIIGAFFIFLGKKNKFIKYLSLAAILGAFFMNINFWLAAGWTSPSTAGFNQTMALIEVVLFVAWIKIY